ncbi:hypothetical protein [Bifidobacterium olomucense]|uniref:Uncharacterized protein n=1 Tax=Bifidobacterium olomucense TaxID=2675324 RepID=A0A7Y0EZF9_9BIFI|nr:hypothetical protein [Bifidobacterium sp. DSM 109959]NMM99220.1 hypothetical protein [Bifidobacterium sp. DSM 109959]
MIEVFHLGRLTNRPEPCEDPRGWARCACGRHYLTRREAVDAGIAAGAVDWMNFTFPRRAKPVCAVTLGTSRLRERIMSECRERVSSWRASGLHIIDLLSLLGLDPERSRDAEAIDRVVTASDLRGLAALDSELDRAYSTHHSMWMSEADEALWMGSMLVLHAAMGQPETLSLMADHRLRHLWTEDRYWNRRTLNERTSPNGSLDLTPVTGVERFSERMLEAQRESALERLGAEPESARTRLLRDALVNRDLPVMMRGGAIIPNTDEAIRLFGARNPGGILTEHESDQLVEHASYCITATGEVDVDYDAPDPMRTIGNPRSRHDRRIGTTTGTEGR